MVDEHKGRVIMKVIEIKRLMAGIIILGMLTIIRIAFFAVDGTKNGVDTAIRLLVYLLSIALVLGTLYLKRDVVLSWIRNPGEKRWVMLYFVVIEISFLLKTGIMPSGIYIFSVVFSMALFIIISALLPRKISKIFDVFWMIIFAFYVLGQDIYYRIFNDLFSARELVSAREGFESSESMFKFEIYQVIVLMILGVLLYLYFRERKTTHLHFTKTLFFFPVMLLFIVQLNSHYPKSIERIYTSEHYLYQTLFHKESFVKHFGIFHYVYRDLADSIIPPFGTQRDRTLLDEHYTSLDKSFDDHDLVGLFEGKNLIYILAESYDEIALNETLTPTLYQLKQEGIDFKNHYTPVFPRTTSDTEFIINTGQIPSIEDGPTSGMFRHNTYRTSMASLFVEKGYQAMAFHANYKEFYGRHILYQGYGYDHFYGQHELSISDDEKRFDTIFYEHMKTYLQSSEPFMAMMMTFSGHSPYTKNNAPSLAHFDQIEDAFGDTIPEEVKHYLATQIELDQMLSMLLADLETWGILEDTVIILSGDHYPYTMNQAYYEEMSGETELYRKQKGNLYMWTPGIVSTDIEYLSSSFDILPMIIQLFDLPGDAKTYIGTDILGGAETLIYFKNYTVYNGTKLIRMNDQNENDELILLEAYTSYKISRLVLRTNYFK